MKYVTFETAQLICEHDIKIGSETMFSKSLEDYWDGEQLIYKKNEISTLSFYHANNKREIDDYFYNCERVEICEILSFLMDKGIYFEFKVDSTLEPMHRFKVKKWDIKTGVWEISNISNLYINYNDMINDAIQMAIKTYC